MVVHSRNWGAWNTKAFETCVILPLGVFLFFVFVLLIPLLDEWLKPQMWFYCKFVLLLQHFSSLPKWFWMCVHSINYSAHNDMLKCNTCYKLMFLCYSLLTIETNKTGLNKALESRYCCHAILCRKITIHIHCKHDTGFLLDFCLLRTSKSHSFWNPTLRI